MAYEPFFSVTPRLVGALGDIAALRERLLSSAVHGAWVPALQREARRRNTQGSTAIEGNTLGLAEVEVLEAGGEVGSAKEREKKEVLNYLQALRFIERRERKARLDHADVLGLHAVVMRGLLEGGLAGRYRPFGVRVGSYVAPQAPKVHGLMADLLEWINGPSAQWPPVITSGIVHFRFEDIHPFADGNGRTGRLLALWELYRKGFDSLHVFSVDGYYWEHRQEYYAAFDQVRKRNGDLTEWLEFVSGAVKSTLGYVLARVDRLAVASGGKDLVLRPRQERILELLRAKRSMAPSEIRQALGVTRQGALDILKPLMEAGLVRRVGGRKTGRYVLV